MNDHLVAAASALALFWAVGLTLPAQAGQPDDPFGAFYGATSNSPSSFNAIPLACSKTTIVDTGGILVGSANSPHFHHAPINESVGGAYGIISFANKISVTIHHVDNRAWMQMQKGDAAQVCRIAVPPLSGTCNPQVDTRGQTFYVYDYRVHGGFVDTSGIHFAGALEWV